MGLAVFPAVVLPFASKMLTSVDPMPVGVAWFAAAAGLMTAMRQLFLLFDHNAGGWTYRLAGVLSVFACIPLMRAIDAFKEIAR